MDEQDLINELTAKVAVLETQLSANAEEETREKEKAEARRAAFRAAMDNLDEEEKDKAIKSIMAQDDEEMKKVAKEYEEEDVKKGRKGMTHDDEKERKANEKEKEKLEAKVRELSARISSYEESEKEKVISELVSLKASLIPTLDEEIYRIKLNAKSFESLKAMYDERKDEFRALTAAKSAPEQKHFGFGSALTASAKMTSIDDILHNGGVN